jgi:diguanylate cyclase (GGDEF)-like protein
MTIGKLDEPSAAPSRHEAPPNSAPVGEVDTAAAVSPEALASVLGVPPTDCTPRVREIIVLLMREIDRLRRELAQTRGRLDALMRAADQDTLLPVLNRRAFRRAISRFIAFAARYGTPSTLLYFDLDGFKAVNDEYGHAAGDAALLHFAKLLAGQIRETDVLARLGGDEFAILLAQVRPDQARVTAERLVETVRSTPLVWETRTIPLDCSYGALELHPNLNADDALKRADDAMYARKRAR